jgi:hypothetical protein
MAEPVARLLAPVHLWVRIQAYLKNRKMGNMSKEMANTSCNAMLVSSHLNGISTQD